MKITISYIKIRNFKGIENLEIAFNAETCIAGRNASGKSTVMDAFMWMLFGKDSQDRKDFNIKNTVNTELNRADHVVEAAIYADDVKYVLRRTYKEKWTKKRGSEEAEFTGHETEFHWDDVPLNQSEFMAKVNFILPEDKFKLITNPMYFNQIKWQDRRDMLSALAGDISLKDAANQDAYLLAVVDQLEKENKSIEDALKQYAAAKKNIKKDLDAIPGRIDEAMRSNGVDQDEIDAEATQKQLEAVTNELTSQSKLFEQQREEIDAKKANIRSLEAELMEVEGNIKREYNKQYEQIDIEIAKLSREFHSLTIEKDELLEGISALHRIADEKKKEMEKLRASWFEVNKTSIHLNGELKCPTCKRELPDAKERELELVESFNKDKAEKLKVISTQGSTAKRWIEQDYPASIESGQSRISSIKERLMVINKRKGELMEQNASSPSIDDVLKANEDVQRINKRIEEAEKLIVMIPDNKAIVELEQQREQLIRTMERFEQQQKAEEARKTRVKELKAQEKKLAQELADLERKEFTISRLQANRVNMIEDAVNSQFGMVSFKMFDKQINGGEKQTCETIVLGVPYQDANHAAQINAGIDIINTFSKHIGITAPIWVDNAEAVNQVIKTDSQLIRLVVTWDDLDIH